MYIYIYVYIFEAVLFAATLRLPRAVTEEQVHT